MTPLNTVEMDAMIREMESCHQETDRRVVRRVLQKMLPQRYMLFHVCKQRMCLGMYADLFYKSLLLSLDDEEEESIEIAELVYLSLTEELLRKEGDVYENLRKRISMLHYFADYFTDSMIELFLSKFRETHRLEARNYALEILTKMQWKDLFYVEENFHEEVDQDEQLREIMNSLEVFSRFSDQELAEVELMQKVFYTYLKVKYQNN